MRHYLIGSWNNADEYDYSGEQLMGSRVSGRSTKLDDIMPHILPNGRANLARYGDVSSRQTRPKQKTAFERITLADRHYSRLEQLSIDLDEELENGIISIDDWTYARKQLDVRLDKAWCRVANARGWTDNLDEYSSKIPEPKSNVVDSSFAHEVVDSLSDENCFKPIIKKFLIIKKKLGSIVQILKQ